MKGVTLICVLFVHGLEVTAQRPYGHTELKSRVQYYAESTRCCLWGWCRCYKRSWRRAYYKTCQSFWDLDSNGDCYRPLCPSGCYNGGTCKAPNQCQCTSTHTGPSCATLTCSHISPCYPGACSPPNGCTCSRGFGGSVSQRCLTFNSENHAPDITRCELLLANIRRSDGKQKFYFKIPCGREASSDIHWINQELFNYAEFSLSSYYEQIPNSPPRPRYVSDSGFGVVYNGVHVKHTKIPRNNLPGRYVALDKTYDCRNGTSDTTPVKDEAFCVIKEPNYKISVEHGDWFTVTYETKSGGFRKLHDVDHNRYYATNIFRGMNKRKTVEFKFDFIAPKHCSETNTRCPVTDEPILLDEDITRLPIQPYCSGWEDDLSGLNIFYLEIFKLSPDIHDELTELEPLDPIFSYMTNETNTSSIKFPEYTPPSPGMYSILLQAVDKANNTKIARRLVLFDDKSDITVQKKGFNIDENERSNVEVGDGGMYVVSAVRETGYMWQTSKNGSKTLISLNWENHFVNHIVKDGKLLNKVLPYPTQFENLADDGILRSSKYVALDDESGQRTLNPIANINGIVKFEFQFVATADKTEPTVWKYIGLKEEYQFFSQLNDGSVLRLWVKATDIMNKTKTDFTEVHIDNTPPIISRPKLNRNVVNGSYIYTTSVTVDAVDSESGVHKIGYDITIEGRNKIVKTGFAAANKRNTSGLCSQDTDCRCVLNECFLVAQTLDLDNCWFMVPKDDLNKTANVTVTVYNQALLKTSFHVQVGVLQNLKGLEEYSGPTNIRVDKKLPTGVRLAWDLPKTASCYGRADIVIVLYLSDGTTSIHRVFSEATSYDLVGLNPDKQYSMALNLNYEGTNFAAMPYTFKTAPQENYLSGGIIAGVTITVLLVIGLLLGIFVVLLRRGHMQPVQRGLRAVSVKYRKSMAAYRGQAYENQSYDPHAESLYMYGDMDFSEIKNFHMTRDDVSFDSLLKQGSFADIFLARIQRNGSQQVVAKTLKDGHSKEDEHLMKAKINFSAHVIGQHENILLFVGAVVAESELGPFIIYEYCGKGTLKDYLVANKNNLTIDLQENLYRFGLGIVRGMAYLAGMKVVHRRLAARNILLDDQLTAKIYGFGPQPDEAADKTEAEDAKPGKREKIPIRWCAPECLKSTLKATEKSDVWSFGVVLWEIFSLGETPYGEIKGPELPARIKAGEKLKKPENTDDKWYNVMTRTWNISQNKRPTFEEIRTELDQMFVTASEDNYYFYRK